MEWDVSGEYNRSKRKDNLLRMFDKIIGKPTIL